MTTLRKKKINELKDAESRQFYYEGHIESGLPIQIRELRKKRGMTQKKLSELTGFDPSNLSNFENPNYEYTPQIGTLQRLANAFDVPLIVRFGSWRELLEWEENLSPEKLAPLSFDEEFANESESVGDPANTTVADAHYYQTNTGIGLRVVPPVEGREQRLPFPSDAELELVWSNTSFSADEDAVQSSAAPLESGDEDLEIISTAMAVGAR